MFKRQFKIYNLKKEEDKKKQLMLLKINILKYMKVTFIFLNFIKKLKVLYIFMRCKCFLRYKIIFIFIFEEAIF